MRNSTRLAVAGFVALAIGVVAALYLGFGPGAQKPSGQSLTPETVARLFSTRLNDAGGQTHAFEQWRGKTLVINFWATWCPPCREEMPEFSRLHTRHAANGVQFVGIALDNADNVAAFAKTQPVSYPLLIAASETTELLRQLGNASLGLPYTVVLGPSGETRMLRLGRVSELDLEAVLKDGSAR